MVRRVEVDRNEEQVVTGLERLYGGTTNVCGVKAGEAGHIQGIGHDDALEPKLFLKQISNNSG